MLRVLVGVDGSRLSQVAEQWAQVVTGQAKGRLTRLETVGGATGTTLRDSVVAHPRVPPAGLLRTPIDAVVVGGDPARALRAEAERRGVDLVVVGARQHSAVVGWRRHDVADYLARHLQVPLVVVPPNASTSGVHRVVVGVSGAPGERDALVRLARLAKSIDAEVVAVHAFYRLGEWWVHADPRSQWSKENHLLESLWCEPLRTAGVLSDVRMADGMDAADILDRSARDLDADLVAVGVDQSGRWGVRRMASVAGQMLHRHLGTALLQIPHSGSRSPRPGGRPRREPARRQGAAIGDAAQPR